MKIRPPLPDHAFTSHETPEAFLASLRVVAADESASNDSRAQARLMLACMRPFEDAINTEVARGIPTSAIANAVACLFANMALNMIESWVRGVPDEAQRRSIRTQAESGFKTLFLGYMTRGFSNVRKLDAMDTLRDAKPEGKA